MSLHRDSLFGGGSIVEGWRRGVGETIRDGVRAGRDGAAVEEALEIADQLHNRRAASLRLAPEFLMIWTAVPQPEALEQSP